MARVFHGFEVKEKIGSGGMSTVYRGVHTTLGYPVAIKTLHHELVLDQSFVDRFEREAKAACSLKHNNIVSVIDFGSEDEIYFIVMEYIDGPDLAQIFESLQVQGAPPRALPAEIALILLEEVAYGLKAAHDNGIIHRDIKPSNVLIGKQGEVKIADFGLARETHSMSRAPMHDLTIPGMVVGTPSYMSPEQAAGRDKLDGRTDIFSLGVMAYQLLSGEKPFVGGTASEIQERIINTPPAPLTLERCPQLTPAIIGLVERMLAKDPGKRYQSMDQVLRALTDGMESIDPTNAVMKHRREYLSQLAQDPPKFVEELRRKTISSHLQRGYHYKNMGLESIGDAMVEFRRVLTLDPDNLKAAKALEELESECNRAGAEASGEIVTAGVDRTMILDQVAATPGTGAGGKARGGDTAGAADANGADIPVTERTAEITPEARVEKTAELAKTGRAGAVSTGTAGAAGGAAAAPAAAGPARREKPKPAASSRGAAARPGGGAGAGAGAGRALSALGGRRLAAIGAGVVIVVVALLLLLPKGPAVDRGALAPGADSLTVALADSAAAAGAGLGIEGRSGVAPADVAPAGAPATGGNADLTGPSVQPAAATRTGAAPSSRGTPAPRAGEPGATGSGAGTASSSAAAAAPAASEGTLELAFSHPCDVYLDGSRRAAAVGVTAHKLEVPAGEHRVTVRAPQIFGEWTGTAVVAAGRAARLEHRFATGRLRLAVVDQRGTRPTALRTRGTILVGDTHFEADLPYEIPAIAAGQHRIGIVLAGREIREAWDTTSRTGSGRRLELERAPDASRCLVEIRAERSHEVEFRSR